MAPHPKQPAIDAANYLLNTKGLPINGAIAVASCLDFESGLKPGSQGNQPTEHGGVLNPEGAYGIASWNGDRQAGLKDFAEKKQMPIDDVRTQLGFVLNEAANHYPQTWLAIIGPASYNAIIPTFVSEYENPADHQKEINAALAIAAEIAPFVVREPVVQEPVVAPTAPVEPAAPLPPQAAPAPSPAPFVVLTPAPAIAGQLVDKEIEALEACYATICNLDVAARARVVDYLYDRFLGVH